MPSLEKLTNAQFFLLINGPSCGGKSSVANVLFEKCSGLFNAKSDTIKWLISDYNPQQYQPVVHQMTLATVRVALADGLSVIKEGAMIGTDEYIKLATRAKVKVYMVNVEAPWAVLQARFSDRQAAKKQGAKISNVDPKRFKELYDEYNRTKMKTKLEFNSAETSPEAIAEAIVDHIRHE